MHPSRALLFCRRLAVPSIAVLALACTSPRVARNTTAIPDDPSADDGAGGTGDDVGADDPAGGDGVPGR